MTTPQTAVARHARKRARPRAAELNRQAYTPPAPRSSYRPARARGRPGARVTAFPRSIANPAGGRGNPVLLAELLAGFVIVGIRALGDYQLTDSGTARGTLNTPGNGGYGPFTVLAGLIGSFFGLSFLAAGGEARAKWANAFGALIVLVLTMKSMDEISIVSGYITADPATRTVAATSWSSGASQPWGAAWQTGSSSPFYGGAFTGATASTTTGGTSGTSGTSGGQSGTQAGGDVVNNAHTES